MYSLNTISRHFRPLCIPQPTIGRRFGSDQSQLHRDRTEEEFNAQSTAFFKVQKDKTRFEKLGVGFVKHANILSGQDSILEIACGPGVIARECIKYNPKSYVGIDISSNMLEIAENEVKNEIEQTNNNTKNNNNTNNTIATNYEFIKCNAESLPFEDNSFDIVISRLAFHHFYDIIPILHEVKRVMKCMDSNDMDRENGNANNGRFLLMDMMSPTDDENSESNRLMESIEILRDPTHVRTFGRNEMLAILESVGFVNGKVIDVIKDERNVIEWIEQTNSQSRISNNRYPLNEICNKLVDLGCDGGMNLRKNEKGELEFTHNNCIWQANKPAL